MQISFNADDLSHVRLSSAGPVVESALAATILQVPGCAGSERWQGRWRRTVAPRVAQDGLVRRLLEVCRPPAHVLDLCLPTAGAGSLDEGLDRLASLGPDYYLTELEALESPAYRRPVPRWTEELVTRDKRARRGLVRAVQTMYEQTLDGAIAASSEAAARRFVDDRVRELLSGGIGQMLGNLHPTIRWATPVLTIDLPGTEATHYPAGHGGFVIAPSIFATRVMFFLDTKFERPDLLVVPIAPLPDQHEPQLDRLLGANRAAVLALLAQGPLCTTDIATRAGLSPAAASDHARVLREAGLLTTDRSRRATHTITPTGAALLGRP